MQRALWAAPRNDPVARGGGARRRLLAHRCRRCLRRRGQPRSRGAALRAASLDPSDFEAHMSLGLAQQELGQYQDAASSLARACACPSLHRSPEDRPSARAHVANRTRATHGCPCANMTNTQEKTNLTIKFKADIKHGITYRTLCKLHVRKSQDKWKSLPPPTTSNEFPS